MGDKLNGRLYIGRWSSNIAEQNNLINIELEDENSGVHVAQIYLSAEDLALALTGMHAKVTYKLHPELAGKHREFKEEFVADPDNLGWFARNDWQKSTLMEHLEVDGWKGFVEDIGNGHRRATRDGVSGWKVRFIRFVD